MNLQNHRLDDTNRLAPLYWGVTALLVIISTAFFLSAFPEGPVMKFARFMSDAGNTAYLAGGYLALIITAAASKRWRNLALALTVLITITIIVQIIKRLDLGPIAMRPCGGEAGFPSGHAASAVALAFLLSLRFARGAAVWYLWAAAIAWSRAQANAHYPFQVAVGAVLGLLTAYILVNMFYRQAENPAGAAQPEETQAARAGESP